MGASSWSFGEEDSRRIQGILRGFLGETNARTALIVDRTGQLVATVGEAPAFDPTVFASLTAADFTQLALVAGAVLLGGVSAAGGRGGYLGTVLGVVLLSLVQGRRERACGAPCPAGQTPAAGGTCVPTPETANGGKTPPEVKSDTNGAAEALPVAGAAAAGAAALVLAAPGTGRPDTKGPVPDAKAVTPGTVRPQAERPGDPVPSEGMVRDRKPRRSAEAPPPRPPKVVRDVLRALGFQ